MYQADGFQIPPQTRMLQRWLQVLTVPKLSKMKYTLLLVLSSLTLICKAQAPNQKLSKDSVRFYQRELSKMWRTTYDSLKNSDRYREISSKLKNKNKVVTVELLANIGLYFTDFENLNLRLKSIGQEEVKTMVPSLGASIAVGKPIMTYGVELNSYAFDNKSASFKGMHMRFYVATNLFKKSPIVLHPQIAFGTSILNMFIHKSPNQVGFENLFQTQANTVNLRHDQNYLDFALGLKLKGRKAENFYWQFLRAGYRIGLKDEPWKMRGGTITNTPTDRNNQFYIQLCLGFDRE